MPGQKVVLEAEHITVRESAEDEDDGYKMIGLAVPFGRESRNGIHYSQSSIEETHKAMEGRTFLYNHDPSRVENVLGHVEETTIVEEGDTWKGKTFEDSGMAFQSDIDPAEEAFVRKVERGDIRTVSIHAMVDEIEPNQEDDDGEEPDADVHVTDWLELSAAPVPGFPGAQVANTGPDGAPAAVPMIENVVGHSERSEQEAMFNPPETDDWEWTETSWEAPDVEDFEDAGFEDPFDAYMTVHLVWYDQDPEDTEDAALPIARPSEDAETFETPYEALNSAYDTVSQVDGVSDEQVSDIREWLEQKRSEHFEDREPLDADEEPDNDDEEDMNAMDDGNDSDEVSDLAEQIQELDQDELEELFEQVGGSSKDDGDGSSGSDDSEEGVTIESVDEKLDQMIELLREFVKSDGGDADPGGSELFETPGTADEGSMQDLERGIREAVTGAGGD